MNEIDKRIDKITSKLKIGVKLTVEEHIFMLENNDNYKYMFDGASRLTEEVTNKGDE